MNRISRSLPDNPAALRETLLRHARSDGPSQLARQRIVAQVTTAAVVSTGAGLLAASVANQGVTVSTAKVGVLVATKWALAGAMVATAALGVREAVVSYDETALSSQAPMVGATDSRARSPRGTGQPPTAPTAAATQAVTVPSENDLAPATAEPAPAPKEAATRSALRPSREIKDGVTEQPGAAPAEPAPAPFAATAPSATPRADATAQLSRELEFLERTRAHLAHQSPIVALDALRDYERTFPTGALKVEASALRVEALAAAGRLQEATGSARAFLAAHPEHPMADRVRTFLARLEARPPARAQ